MDKQGVSLMVSYILLIVIVLSLSVGVFSYFRYLANIDETPDCEDETSVIISDYKCYNHDSTISGFNLYITNTGNFKVDGILVKIGNNTQKIPIISPVASGGNTLPGQYEFENSLNPGETKTAKFTKQARDQNGNPYTILFDNVKIITIQPILLKKDGLDYIVCEGASITQEIEECELP